MKFIVLTDLEGRTFYVRAKSVTDFYREEIEISKDLPDYTVVTLSNGSSYEVVETPKEILQRLIYRKPRSCRDETAGAAPL